MRIYIDESGIFNSNKDAKNSISCVTALVIPEVFETKVFEDFEQWKLSPAIQEKLDLNGEVKGSKLDEKDIFSLLLKLSKYDVIVETVCLDLGETTEEEIILYRDAVADNFAKSNIGRQVNVDFKKDVIRALNSQLFMQLYSLIELINQVLTISLSYYAQRLPGELGSFDWYLDEKGKPFEKIFYALVCSYLQNINFDTVTGVLDGEDYSSFEKFLIPLEQLSNIFKKNVPQQPLLIYCINDIMKNLNFAISSNNSGLQIVDIISNCIRRGMRGNLQFKGWQLLSGVIVKRNNGVINILSISPHKRLPKQPYTRFINYLRICGKQMLVPNHLKERVKDSQMGYIHWSYTEEDITQEIDHPIKKTTLEYY